MGLSGEESREEQGEEGRSPRTLSSSSKDPGRLGDGRVSGVGPVSPREEAILSASNLLLMAANRLVMSLVLPCGKRKQRY